MKDIKMYQVSTLQALLLGYSRAVVSVSELLKHGDIGLGTFTDVDGEMIRAQTPVQIRDGQIIRLADEVYTFRES